MVREDRAQQKEDPMWTAPFSSRLERFREKLVQKNLDAFLVCTPENRYYLSGYGEEDLTHTESSGYLFITPRNNYLFTDFRYGESAREAAPHFELVLYSEGVAQVLPGVVEALGLRHVGIEGHYITHESYLHVENSVKSVSPNVEVSSVSGLVEEMRIIKEPWELEAIKKSLRVTEAALQHVWDKLEPGVNEKDMAWEIERFIREQGAEDVSFPPIVAAGPRGALPHAVPSERKIEGGDTVILDLGSRLNHYCSDMTRTWMGRDVPEKLRQIYRVVLEAQRAAMEQIRAGQDTVKMDGVARSVIEGAGYGEHFGHGLGHGVGLAVHEKPGLRKRNPVILEENMVVTVEPGIYLPGLGGVRLENMVRVTQDGCEVLNELDLMYA